MCMVMVCKCISYDLEVHCGGMYVHGDGLYVYCGVLYVYGDDLKVYCGGL